MTCRNKMTDFRIQVTSTKGEQLVVERQFQVGPDTWQTIEKYLTTDLARIPKNHSKWMELALAMFKNPIVPRCLVCDFPLVDKVEEGCVPGNCSYRPALGTAEYTHIANRRAALLAAEDAYCTVAAVEEHAPQPALDEETNTEYCRARSDPLDNGKHFLRKLVPPTCVSAEAGIVCGEPQAAHTLEAAKTDVGMDHDFVDPEKVLPSIY